jgi:hypothetical protein
VDLALNQKWYLLPISKWIQQYNNSPEGMPLANNSLPAYCQLPTFSAIFYFDVLEINIGFGEIINMILNY